MDLVIFYSLIAFLALTGIVLFLYLLHRDKRSQATVDSTSSWSLISRLIKGKKEIVEKTSKKLKSLKQYNRQQSFHVFGDTIVFRLTSSSAPSDHGSSAFKFLVREKAPQFSRACRLADENAEKYKLYKSNLDQSLEATSHTEIKKTHIPFWLYSIIEKQLCKEAELHPQLCFETEILIYDNSEENHLFADYHFSYDHLVNELSLYYDEVVAQTSEKLSKLKSLNSDTYQKYKPIGSSYSYQKTCSSLAEYRKYDGTNLFLEEIINSSFYHFKSIIQNAASNHALFVEYQKTCNLISPTDAKKVAATEIDRAIYYAHEQTLFSQQIIPSLKYSFTVHVEISYVSPQGRNYYHWATDYPYDSVRLAFDRIQEKKKRELRYKQSKAYERSKMNDSLRYDVMKRDGFRCVLCGASANDGVELHVDHIKPIAKGGKTEMSNLRTLCSRCNMGKRDKYDPYGPN